MKTSKLTFEKKFQEKNPSTNSGDRNYIDFIIDGISLSELLGGVGHNIGKFGWGFNLDYESKKVEELKSTKGSSHENNLHSIYVCAECGDEGCGAVMFEIIENQGMIEWKNFVWADGYLDEGNNPNDPIDYHSIYFSKSDYFQALSILKKLIAK